MGLFKDLMSKIFSHAATPVASNTTAAQPTGGATATGTATAVQTPAAAVDVAAILTGLAAKNPEKLDWKHSIVDLMKLVGMDSSHSARNELAKDLHYTGDPNDSASMNIWLHHEVMTQLANNGGKVPQELLAT
jgi:hypothetical protein